MRVRYLLLLIAAMTTILSCTTSIEHIDFIRQADGRLWEGSREYKFTGANLWYAALLASEAAGGDRERLCAELDTLHALGIDNLRVLVGADGETEMTGQVWPTLQTSSGQYNDALLDGLDYLLQEMGKRYMRAVLYFNNAWTWSGGYSYYLRQAGLGQAPSDMSDYRGYTAFVAQFSTCQEAKQMYLGHLRNIVGRTNRYTNQPYAYDPTIMAWQLCNEPRAFCDTLKAEFAAWLSEAAATIRNIDPNHLISTGSEGLVGCNFDADLHKAICSDPNIDYITMHIWPTNWGWARRDAIEEDLDTACILTTAYIEQHVELARELHKPIVIEEFGYPRDGFSYSPSSATLLRNSYYQHIADIAAATPEIAGLNFWAWGGTAIALHEMWIPGDPLMGDPPQEPQGLFSVFARDTATISILRK